MTTKITSYTVHYTAEGTRVSYVYSQIDENGNLVKSNQRSSVFIMDENINQSEQAIKKWLLGRITG